ncbi:MAG: type II secretion system protein [Lachnospiraceae bacterium]|nr:type II secretion system protein [Lachnospiraceae bacterium]
MKKMNNKGFSLVELIIVIAIMAILIAVLAPQYIKYVEKSRKSSDLDNYQKLVDAIQVVFADEDNTIGDGAYTFKLNAKGSTNVVDSTLDPMLKNLGVDVSAIHTKSTTYGGKSITATKSATGVVITCDDDALAAELGLTT